MAFDAKSTLQQPCYKIVTCDIRDEIIDLKGSLMYGIARNATLNKRAKLERDLPEKVQ